MRITWFRVANRTTRRAGRPLFHHKWLRKILRIISEISQKLKQVSEAIFWTLEWENKRNCKNLYFGEEAEKIPLFAENFGSIYKTDLDFEIQNRKVEERRWVGVKRTAASKLLLPGLQVAILGCFAIVENESEDTRGKRRRGKGLRVGLREWCWRI